MVLNGEMVLNRESAEKRLTILRFDSNPQSRGLWVEGRGLWVRGRGGCEGNPGIAAYGYAFLCKLLCNSDSNIATVKVIL